MTERKEKTVLDEFGPKHFKRFKEYQVIDRPAVKSVSCAVDRHQQPAEVLAGCCEFATGPVHAVVSGRICEVDRLYCPPSVFKDSAIFEACDTRKEKLAKLAAAEQP